MQISPICHDEMHHFFPSVASSCSFMFGPWVQWVHCIDLCSLLILINLNLCSCSYFIWFPYCFFLQIFLLSSEVQKEVSPLRHRSWIHQRHGLGGSRTPQAPREAAHASAPVEHPLRGLTVPKAQDRARSWDGAKGACRNRKKQKEKRKK